MGKKWKKNGNCTQSPKALPTFDEIQTPLSLRHVGRGPLLMKSAVIKNAANHATSVDPSPPWSPRPRQGYRTGHRFSPSWYLSSPVRRDPSTPNVYRRLICFFITPRCGRDLPNKNTYSMLRVIPSGEISCRKTSHQASENLLPTKLPPHGFHDGPFVRRFALVGHEVHRWA
jgi:hypothetical protein